ncbi:MAG: YitT family protein [Firmicutes bacterium]|nr:YitT family protein [Dethiobacter sp.]MBS3889621.1 YitT family protein [Bacillota bacterium]MBS4055384.1 YitT family protein [Thermaerobacter sp.]
MKIIKGYVWPIIVILIGALCSAASFNMMLLPHRMLAGGVSGMSIIIGTLTGWPIGILVLIFNLPILYLGYRYIGGKFIMLTSFAVLMFSTFLDWVPVSPAVDDIILASVFGGAMNGLGLGLVFKAGASTGGTDVLGVILNRKFSLSIGEVLMAFNAIIVGLGAVLFDLTSALYTLLAMFVTARIVDSMQSSRDKKNVLIVSTKPEEVAKALNAKLLRGVTFLHGEGAYEQQPRKVIVCVLTRFELVQLKETVFAIDPTAFMTISDVEEVVGRFAAYNPFRKH